MDKVGDVLHRDIAALGRDRRARRSRDPRIKNARARCRSSSRAPSRANVKGARDREGAQARVTEELERLGAASSCSTTRSRFHHHGDVRGPRAGPFTTQRVRLPFPWLNTLNLPRCANLGGEMKTLVPGSSCRLALVGCSRRQVVETAWPGRRSRTRVGYSYDYRATPEGVVIPRSVIDDEAETSPSGHRRSRCSCATSPAMRCSETTDRGVTRRHEGEAPQARPRRGRQCRSHTGSASTSRRPPFIVEAGGQEGRVRARSRTSSGCLASVKVKCDTFVSPVLASRTCNRGERQLRNENTTRTRR